MPGRFQFSKTGLRAGVPLNPKEPSARGTVRRITAPCAGPSAEKTACVLATYEGGSKATDCGA